MNDMTIGLVFTAVFVVEIWVLYKIIPATVRSFMALRVERAAAPRPAVQATAQSFGPVSQPAPAPQPAQARVVMPPPTSPTASQPATRTQPCFDQTQQPTPVVVPVQPAPPPTPVGPIHKPADYDDYYDVLAVLPDSSEAEIKAAYRSLIKLWHTDVCKAHDAQAQMNAITEAYEVLSDPDQRKLYAEGLRFEESL